MKLHAYFRNLLLITRYFYFFILFGLFIILCQGSSFKSYCRGNHANHFCSFSGFATFCHEQPCNILRCLSFDTKFFIFKLLKLDTDTCKGSVSFHAIYLYRKYPLLKTRVEPCMHQILEPLVICSLLF